eukprot:452429_1
MNQNKTNLHITNSNPPKSPSKPIKKQQLLKSKFGNYFSKSPKLTNNRISSKQIKINKKNNNNNNNNSSQQLFDNFVGTGLMVNISTHQTNKRQISSESIASNSNTISTSNNTIQRLSNSTDNSTPHSHSNSNSLDIDNNNNIHNIPSLKTQPSANTRTKELFKEYIAETESTVSSSDIQDDISSVASDEPQAWKRPPRNAPPPPPHSRPPPLPIPRYAKHNHSSSMTLTSNNMQKYSATPTPKRCKPKPPSRPHNKDTSSLKLNIDEINTIKRKPNNTIRKYSKSALTTPNDSPNANTNSKPTETEIINNPYIENAVDFSAIMEHKQLDNNNSNNTQLNGALPPPLSPKNSGHHLNHNIQQKRPSSATLRGYRSRQNSLPYYEVPNRDYSRSHQTLPVPHLSKSRSANNDEEKKSKDDANINANSNGNNGKRIKQTKSVDMTDYNKYANKSLSRIHRRAMSARHVDEISQSEKIFQNRRTVLHRLSRGKNKKDVMSKLDISIGKVEEKLKIYVRNLVALQDELSKCNNEMTKELTEWENINNFSLTNLCRSYYSNYALLIQTRIEIATKYCECFRDKYRQLKKTRDRIKKDAKKFSLDDLVLTVEAAMMTASNIRLPQDINIKRDNEKSLNIVINELKKKYNEKKYEDVIQPMTAQDRTKHILTMLVQIIDTSNKTTMTKNVSDGLPYFHPTDNGYQVPFEQLLYDPRFTQKNTIAEFISKYVNNNNEINVKIIDKENLSLTRISTFIYRLTNSFLDSCELNKDSPFFQRVFLDCTNLMIGRSIFPKFDKVIKYVICKDINSVEMDDKYRKQLIWMCTMTQQKVGIDNEFCYYYVKKIKSLKQTMLKPKKIERKSTIFIDEQSENEEKIAYYKPIQRLKELQNICVPQDSIVLVIDTVHDIQKCAMKYNKMKNGKLSLKKKKQVVISGDSLFPIVVYCLIQSNVDYWNRWIFMMKKFYTQKILSFGQTGFCFSLINAAVKYIMDQKPSNFGLDDELMS